MNTNKDPLLEKNSIELDVLTEEGRGGEIKNKISSPKRSNLKKSPKHIEAVSYPQNDFFHDSSMVSKIIFSWINNFITVKFAFHNIFSGRKKKTFERRKLGNNFRRKFSKKFCK